MTSESSETSAFLISLFTEDNTLLLLLRRNAGFWLSGPMLSIAIKYAWDLLLENSYLGGLFTSPHYPMGYANAINK